jgi:hypothetical protein
LTYTLRPSGAALWLPEALCRRLGIERGDQLTDAQFFCEEIQTLIAARLRSEGKRERPGADLF